MNNINKIFNYERNIINDNDYLFLDQMIYKMFKIATNNLQCLKKYEGTTYTSYVKSLLTASPFPCFRVSSLWPGIVFASEFSDSILYNCVVEEFSCFVGVK